MKVHELFENKKEKLMPVDSIAMLLFKKKAEVITDPKHEDKKFIGVSHEKSTIKDENGKSLNLTFDNSTESGDFEINSLTPLKIEKGGDLDREIKRLFTKHELESKKKTGYVVKGDISYLREIILGKQLGRPAVKFVSDLLKLLRKGASEEEETEEDVKKASSEKKSSKKE
jgi:hypothetical protein